MSATANARRRSGYGLGYGLVLGLGLALAQADQPAAAAAEPPYVGAMACGACHASALAIWQASAHARAAARLTAGERARRACQSCHATGDVPASPAAFAGVECEACHGAGRDYAPADVMRDPPLARALGLAELGSVEHRRALCATCHEVGRAAFDLDAAWRQIAHPEARR